MEKPPPQENEKEQVKKYFETYEIRQGDLEALEQGIDILAESQLLEEKILDDIRFVTYDSRHLYVFTRGEHATNERFNVEQVPSSSTTGFKIFKIPHSDLVGKEPRNYKGAYAWFLCDEIETTSLNAKKFPNENVLHQPSLPQPKKILDAVSVPPLEPYNKIQQGCFNYLTDVIFHEAGHIEHRRLENWQEGKKPTEVFSTNEQKEKFLSVIRQTKIFPEWIINLIIENIGDEAINEMYPMVIDREAAKRYDVQKFDDENKKFQEILVNIQSEPVNQKLVEQFKKSLSEGGHVTGRLLVRILEERLPDFKERKKFVRSVLERTSEDEKNLPKKID